MLRRQRGRRRLDNIPPKAEARGDGQGVAAAGQADDQPVGRGERLHVELDRGVLHAGRAVGVGFQLGVVGRGDRRRAARPQEIEDGARQRRAFHRVGAGAQLVQQHQVAALHRIHDAHDIGHVRREGGQALLDALLVADVGPDLADEANLRAGVGRDVQAGQRHQRQQSDRLQGDRLAAGVGSGDHELGECRRQARC